MSQFNKYLEIIQERKDYNYNEGMFDFFKSKEDIKYLLTELNNIKFNSNNLKDKKEIKISVFSLNKILETFDKDNSNNKHIEYLKKQMISMFPSNTIFKNPININYSEINKKEADSFSVNINEKELYKFLYN